MNVPYISGQGLPPDLPLGRFLPPIPQEMVSAWCRKNLEAGSWILEPFGFNPLIPIEMVAAGHPVLVTANNPIHAFLIRMLASAPQKDELVAALQDLAIEPKGDERIEPYIRSLYYVNCADCGRQIEAEAFLWKKEAKVPYAAIVECPHCGAQGEQELDEETQNSLTELPPARLHQARALNRIASQDDPLRAQVENALSAYPTRPLIILQTIINKLESLEQTSRRRDLLIALILSAADQGNTLWAYPSPRNRPRQIVVPSVYQEKNLWKAMEEAIDTWQVLQTPIPILDWDGQIPEIPAITLYEGRLKELTPVPESGSFSAVIAAIPRPNQAFWTLSALWTGWIWGQEAVGPIRQVLSRQRYDWNWHTNALKGVFDVIHVLSDSTSKIWGLVTENEPMLLLSTLLAADSVGCQLSAFAQSSDDQLAQCEFQLQTDVFTTVQPADSLSIARDHVTEFLRNKGEPADYEQVHAAAITALAHESALAIDIFMENENQYASETQKLIETLFEERGFLTRVAGGTASLETGDWWLADPGDVKPPMIDRLEKIVVQHLIETGSTTAEKLTSVAYQALPGIYTPTREDLFNCLDSYGEPVDPETRRWVLRDSDQPAARKADVLTMRKALTRMAQRLEYDVKGDDPLLWMESSGEGMPAFSFHILASAIVQKHMQIDSAPAGTKILLIPGSRANLLAYKKQRDPVLKETLDRNYIVVKFRLIRDLEVNPLLSRELFKEQILVDPPEYRSSQLALF